MKQYVGQDISEVLVRYGQPANVIQFPDGRRGFQFRYGGGTVVIPGYANSTIQAYGNMATVNTIGTPATAYQSPGCLITFVAQQEGNSWRVVDTRPPKELVC